MFNSEPPVSGAMRSAETHRFEQTRVSHPASLLQHRVQPSPEHDFFHQWSLDKPQPSNHRWHQQQPGDEFAHGNQRGKWQTSCEEGRRAFHTIAPLENCTWMTTVHPRFARSVDQAVSSLDFDRCFKHDVEGLQVRGRRVRCDQNQRD